MRVMAFAWVMCAGCAGAWTQTSQTLQPRPVSPKTGPLQQPYVAEFRNTTQRPDGGVEVTLELHVSDEQGRQLFRSTNFPGGSTSFQVIDPVAQNESPLRLVWTTETHEVKVLYAVPPMAGRKSCWRVEDDGPFGRGEPQIGIHWISCAPVESRMQPPFCIGHAVPAPPKAAPRNQIARWQRYANRTSTASNSRPEPR
jgi:hypothetical protein